MFSEWNSLWQRQHVLKDEGDLLRRLESVALLVEALLILGNIHVSSKVGMLKADNNVFMAEGINIGTSLTAMIFGLIELRA